MDKVRLLPEQISFIKERINALLENIGSLRADMSNRENRPAGCGLQGFDYVADFSTLNEISKIKGTVNELEELLNNSVIVSEYDSTKIGIGTRFIVSLDLGKGEIDTTDYVLLESLEMPKMDGVTYISLASPLGKAVYGRSTNEVICYTTPDKRIIGGLVEDIAPSRGTLKLNSSENGKQYTKR